MNDDKIRGTGMPTDPLSVDAAKRLAWWVFVITSAPIAVAFGLLLALSERVLELLERIAVKISEKGRPIR